MFIDQSAKVSTPPPKKKKKKKKTSIKEKKVTKMQHPYLHYSYFRCSQDVKRYEYR